MPIPHFIAMEISWELRWVKVVDKSDGLKVMDKNESPPALGFLWFILPFGVSGVGNPRKWGRGFLLLWGSPEVQLPLEFISCTSRAWLWLPVKQNPGKSARVERGNNKGREEGELGCAVRRATELGWVRDWGQNLWIKVKETLLTLPSLGLSSCDGFWWGKAKEQIGKASKIFLGSPKDEGGLIHVETWRDPWTRTGGAPAHRIPVNFPAPKLHELWSLP